jgi:hypothetical protein
MKANPGLTSWTSEEIAAELEIVRPRNWSATIRARRDVSEPAIRAYRRKYFSSDVSTVHTLFTESPCDLRDIKISPILLHEPTNSVGGISRKLEISLTCYISVSSV